MVGIGFFAPLPLAMMMPFMAGQSMIMGDAFGKAYQYGKRKISAMSNEEFNKLDAASLATQLQTDYMSMIPSLKASVIASRDFQKMIIEELVRIVPTIPGAVVEGLTGETNSIFANADTGNTTQKNFQSSQASGDDFLKQLGSFFSMMAGMGGRVITSGPGPNPETPEEEAAANLLTTSQTETQGPTNLSNQFGFKEKSLTYLLNNQKTFISYKAKHNNLHDWKKVKLAENQGTNIPNPAEEKRNQTFRSNPQEVQTYLSIRGNLWGQIKEQQNKQKSLGTRAQSQYQAYIRSISELQRQLIAHIAKYRNIQSTKALANNDYNKRIWK